MEKLPKYLSTVGLLAVVWGAFSVPYASAITIYQQFSDSSGEIELTGSVVVLASFTVSNEIEIVDSELQMVIRNNSGSSGVNLFSLGVSTTTNDINARLVQYVMKVSPTGAFIPNDNVEIFAIGTTTTVSPYATAVGVTTYEPGTIYYVIASAGITDVFVTTNLSQDFYYGYLTAGGLSVSLPILPGLPGYTDFGISTTSQQVYCYGNFSTSTGLLDSIGQSISLGICNVGVFLFVPSTDAVNLFFSKIGDLEQRQPFAWAFDVRDIYTDYVATTASAFPALSLAATSSGALTPIIPGELTLLSQDSINTLLPAGVLTAFRTLISAIIWLSVISLIYRRVSNVWHTRVT